MIKRFIGTCFAICIALFATQAIAAHVTTVDPGHTYVTAQVGANQDDVGAITVPKDAPSCHIGSVSVMEYNDAPFSATVTFSQRPGDTSGAYGSIERTFYYQIAMQATTNGIGPPPTCAPRENVIVVQPGTTLYVTVSLAHAGKVGGVKLGRPRNIAYYHRPAV